MIILSTLLDKYRYLNPYLAFEKNDYSCLIEKYKSKLSFLEIMNTEDFKAITFLECLFKVNRFTIMTDSLVILIRSLTSHTGITFKASENSKTVLDTSYIIVYQVQNHLMKTMEDKFGEKILMKEAINMEDVQDIIQIFVSTWTHINEIYSLEVFNNFFKEKIKVVLHRILILQSQCFSRISINIDSKFKVDHSLTKQLETYSNLMFSNISNSVNQSKCDHYRDFFEIDCSEGRKDFSQTLEKLSSGINNVGIYDSGFNKLEHFQTKQHAHQSINLQFLFSIF